MTHRTEPPNPPTREEPDTLFHNNRNGKNLAVKVGNGQDSHHGPT